MSAIPACITVHVLCAHHCECVHCCLCTPNCDVYFDSWNETLANNTILSTHTHNPCFDQPLGYQYVFSRMAYLLVIERCLDPFSIAPSAYQIRYLRGLPHRLVTTNEVKLQLVLRAL